MAVEFRLLLMTADNSFWKLSLPVAGSCGKGELATSQESADLVGRGATGGSGSGADVLFGMVGKDGGAGGGSALNEDRFEQLRKSGDGRGIGSFRPTGVKTTPSNMSEINPWELTSSWSEPATWWMGNELL